MKIAQSTRQTIVEIKCESQEVAQQLDTYLERIRIMSGTKRAAQKLEKAIASLREWQREPI